MNIAKKALKNFKPGDLIIIDNVPCRVEDVRTTVSGKHGAAKTRIEAIGLFDNRRRSIIGSSDDEAEVPMIKRKKAQVLSIINNIAQLMDLETYEQIEIEIPEEKKDKIKEGEEIYYYEIMGIKTLKDLK